MRGRAHRVARFIRATLGTLGMSLVLACAAHGTTSSGDVEQRPPDPLGKEPPRVLADGLAITAIDSVETFEKYAYRDGGLLLPGRTLKFLIDRRDPEAKRVYFQNANYTRADGTRGDEAKYHHPFAARVLPSFTEDLTSFGAVTYDVQDKRYIAGSIQTYYLDGDPTPLYGIQYFPQDVAREDIIVETVQTVLPQFRIPGARIAFVATGLQQRVNSANAARLAELGAPLRTLDDLLGKIDFIPLNRGEAWGYLRVFPKDLEALSPLDIPVFKELPLDLSVVAGTITVDYQDPTSHVNLKAKERGTPNMVLRSASPSHEALAALLDKPVHLVVEVDRFVIEPATEAAVAEVHAKRAARPWIPLPYKPFDKLLSYDDMCPTDPAECLAFTQLVGGKAASLGFLMNKDVLGQTSDEDSLSHRYGYDLVPAGLGVPFKFYKDFVEHPPNAALRKELEALIGRLEKGDLPPKELHAQSAKVRELFLSGELPPGMSARVAKRISEVLPGVPKVKVRSSANAEDMPNFDGAGLYASFAANLKKDDDEDKPCTIVSDGVKAKVKPKTLTCAMKAVFGSVWNRRAIEERTFARLDHRTALMGFAIVADYELEEPVAANSVVVTRVINSRNVYGYTLASQKGNVLVTNPEPGTLAENMIAAFNQPGEPPSFAVTRFAIPVAGEKPLEAPVLSDKAMRELVEITRTAEVAYCRARPDYYPNDCRYAPADPDKTRALDFELKYLESGRFICKQMREFSGR